MTRYLLLLILSRLFRFAPFSSHLYSNIQRRISSHYNILIELRTVSLFNLQTVILRGLSVSDNLRGVTSIDVISLKINFIALFNNDNLIPEIAMDGINMQMNEGSDYQNNIKQGRRSKGDRIKILSTILLKYVPVVLNYLPTKIFVSNFRIFYRGPHNIEILMPSFLYDYGVGSFEIGNVRDNVFRKTSFKVIVEKRNEDVHIFFTGDLGELIGEFGRINDKSYLEGGHMDLEFVQKRNSDNKVCFSLSFSIKDSNLIDNHLNNTIPLSKELITLLFNCRLNSDGLLMEESSFIQYNQLKFFFDLRFFFDSKYVEIKARLPDCSIKNILRSIKRFKFYSLYQESLSGFISVYCSFSFQIDNPNKHHLKVRVIDKLSFNSTNKIQLQYLNFPFVYPIFKEGKRFREIMLNESNKQFVQLSNLSSHLKKVILTTEDRNFYSHRGFDQGYIGQSIVVNFLRRRIVRGASTITMQLARNLYLSHNRSVFRKLEEIYFTYLIEQVFFISKDRVFEIYLNIIEFGPNIYGIYEATKFYFSKTPAEISLTEAIVISYIIPRPNFFLDALEERSITLLNNLRNHIITVSTTMLKRNLIDVEEYSKISFEIQFTSALGKIDLGLTVQ